MKIAKYLTSILITFIEKAYSIKKSSQRAFSHATFRLNVTKVFK